MLTRTQVDQIVERFPWPTIVQPKPIAMLDYLGYRRLDAADCEIQYFQIRMRLRAGEVLVSGSTPESALRLVIGTVLDECEKVEVCSVHRPIFLMEIATARAEAQRLTN